MEGNSRGRIISCDASLANARVPLRGLNYPGGLAVAEGQLWFAESFGHRLSRAGAIRRRFDRQHRRS